MKINARESDREREREIGSECDVMWWSWAIANCESGITNCVASHMSLDVSETEREWAWVAFLWPSRSVFFNLVTIFKWKMRLWETKRDELVIAIAIAIDLVIELSFRLYLFHFITLMGFEPICKSSSLYDIYIYYTCVGVWMCSSVNIQFKKENC